MRQRSLTEGGVLASLLAFAVPVLAALFLQVTYGAADLLIVGQFAGTPEQSGVATGSQLMNMATMCVTGLAMGVTVTAGEAIGEKDLDRARRTIGTSLCIFAVVAAVATVILMVGAGGLATLLHAPAEAFGQTVSYLTICGAGMAFIVAYNVLGAIFRGVGDSRTPLLTVAIACVVNIAGDLALVAGAGLGAAGAAISTVLAQGVSVAVSLAIIRRRGAGLALSRSDLRFDRGLARKVLRVGIPVALQEMLVQFSFVFIQVVGNGMGVTNSAAIGVGERVCGYLMLVASAYLQSISAFVAQNNGAGRSDRSRKALFVGMRTALLAGALMGWLAFFHGDALASLFSPKPDVIAAAHDYLRAYAIDCLLTAELFCFVGYFNGCERTRFVLVQGLVGTCGLRVPVVWLMSRIPGCTLFMVGLGTPIASVVQILMCVVAYRRMRVRS